MSTIANTERPNSSGPAIRNSVLDSTDSAVIQPSTKPYHSFYSWYSDQITGRDDLSRDDNDLIVLLDSDRADLKTVERAILILQNDPFIELVDFSGDLYCSMRLFLARNKSRFSAAEKSFQEIVASSS